MIDRFIIPPTEPKLVLLWFVILVLSCIHLAFIHVCIGTSFFSLLFNWLDGDKNSRHRRLARDLIAMAMNTKGVIIIFGVVPSLVLILTYAQVLYATHLPAPLILSLSFIMAIPGLILIYQYGRSMNNVVSGLTGWLSLLLAYFLFITAAGLIADNDTSLPPFSFSWNLIARYLEFVVVSFAASGVAALLIAYKNYHGEPDQSYCSLVRNFAISVFLASTVLMVIPGLWTLATLPEAAISPGVFICTMVFFMLLLASAILTVLFLFHDNRKFIIYITALFLLAFCINVLKYQIVTANALQEQREYLITLSPLNHSPGNVK